MQPDCLNDAPEIPHLWHFSMTIDELPLVESESVHGPTLPKNLT